MNFMANAEAKQKVWDLIKDIHIAQMVTQGDDGKLYARPMGAQEKDEQGRLWFFTEKNSPKISEIEQNPHVLLSYAEPDKQNYVSINGTAFIVNDKAKIHELWSEMMTTWFPKGENDPNITLICVQPDSAEYWDVPSSSFIHAYGYMKAKFTGKQPHPGDIGKVSMAS